MSNPKIYWTKELVIEEAKKYTCKSAFHKGRGGAYKRAIHMGWLDEACSHMKRPTTLGRTKWNIETVKEEAKKYQRRVDFQRGSNTAYCWAKRHKAISEVCPHMPVNAGFSGVLKSKKPKVKRRKRRCKNCNKLFLPYNNRNLKTCSRSCYVALKVKTNDTKEGYIKKKFNEVGQGDFPTSDRSYAVKQGKIEREKLYKCSTECLLDEFGDIE